jgi:hypothetical protein
MRSQKLLFVDAHKVGTPVILVMFLTFIVYVKMGGVLTARGASLS